MNRIYRLCWNAATSQWVAASELAKNSRPAPSSATPARGPRAASIAIAISLALGSTSVAHAGQTGGQIVSGNGSIQQGGAVTTIQQNSQHLSLNWQTFDVGSNETVNFVQPGRDAIAVNRILGNKASDIQGHLNANGQVWLINPNGVVFGEHAQVNVGGLVASTLDTSDDSLDARTRTFSGDGKGAVVNKGTLHAADGGYVALVGNTVSNQGVVTARLGTVAMGGGSAVTLSFDGSQLVNMQVDRSTLDNLVENRQLVQADGGRVIMTAGARDSLLASAVNNTGVVRAQTVENRNGEIVLLGGMTAGHVNVEGTLDASAPHGGNGGSIETSAAFANLGSAHVTAAAPKGTAGTWLIDPYDLTIDQVAANTIATSLNGGTNVTEQTTAGGATGAGTVNASGSGDINVNAAINWTNPSATLTLDAYRNINVNQAISGPGGVVMKAGSGGTGNITLAAAVRGDAGVTLTAASHFVNQAGANAISAANGRWLVYSASPVGDTTGGLVPGFIQYNAPSGTAPVVGGNGFLYALAPTVTLGAPVGTVRKDYDGGTAASLTGANFNASGLVNGDTIATGTGTYGSKDAASGIQVTTATAASAYTFKAADGLTPVYGYGVAGGGASANVGVIDPKQLGISIVNNPTKTYNGTTTATLTSGNYLTTGLVSGESITFSQPNSVAYDAADAGARTVTANFVPSNFVAATGTKLSNYVLPTTATGAGTINKAKVQLSGLIGTDKVYDGSTTDSLDKSRATIFGVIAADAGNATLDASAGAGVFADANVGSNKSVTATGFQLVGSKASNYDLVAQSDITASITPKTLTINGVSAASKVYDATTATALGYSVQYGLQGVVGSDAVTLDSAHATGNFATRNVGNGIGVTVTGFSLAGAGAGNYNLAQPTGLTANITPAPLTLTITGNPTRTYNGTVNANIGAGDVTIQGWKGSDGGSVVQSAGATYDTKDAGTRTVTASIEASDFSLGNGTSLSNYTFAPSITGQGTITKAPLTWSIVGNPSKTYDGNTNATLSSANYGVYGFIDGEGATVTRTQGTYATADAGVRLVTANVGANDFSPINGTNLANYVLPTSITGYGYIEQADTSGVFVRIVGMPTRVYDGTTIATLTSSNYSVTGQFAPGEGFTISKTQGNYATKNVGKQPITVTLADSDYQPIGSTNPDNYKPLPTTAYGTGEITQAILTASIVGNPSKVYDGTTYQSLGVSNYQIDGFVSGEGADIVPSKSVHYDTKNVGTGKTITADMAVTSYLAHSGTDLTNYQLDFEATGLGAITAAPLYIIGVSANNKTYDTTTAATLNSAGARLVGLVSADAPNVTLATSTNGTFASADAGTRTVTALGFGISGSEASNYALQPLTGLTATINPFTLNIGNVVALSKNYDGNTAIALDTSNATLNTVFASDAGGVSLDASGATGSVRSANAANGLDVTTTGFALTGSRASNYRVNQVGGLTANINRAPITAVITGNPTKPYDGSNSVTLLASDYTLSGFVAGQGATIPQSSTAHYNGVNAGSNVGLSSTLSVSDFVAGAGTNLANYALPTSASGTLGTITPFIINLTSSRVYDATTNAAASLFTDGNGTVLGVNGERVSLTGTGTLVTKNVGSQRAFQSLGSLALGDYNGASAGNYTLAGGIDWVTITPYTLTVSGTLADDKIYDGNRNAALHGSVLNGVLGSDAVSLGGTSTGTFDTKNVGTGKTVTTAMSISGTDAGNYILQQPSNVTASITQKHVTVSANGITRTYDGTTGANATSLAVNGMVANDAVGATGTKAFDTKDAGSNKTINVTQIGLTGGDAGNYALDNVSTTTTGTITPRVVNLSGTRMYDQTTNAAATGLTMGNLVSGETLALSGVGTLGSKNVGSYSSANTGTTAFSLGSLALADGSGSASNYTLVGGTDTYSVTKAPLTVLGTVAASKIYDGNTAAALSGSVLNGAYAGDAVALGNTAVGTFNNKNVGQNKTVTTAFTLTGGDAGNYQLTQPGNVKADITAKGITVVATGVNKVYDGTLASYATLSSADLAAGDQVTFGAASNLFADKNVNTGIGVTVDGITMGGSGAGNYTLLNTQATTSAAITPYIINLTGTRIYDQTNVANAATFGAGGVVSGVAGETLRLSGSATTGSKNVATYNQASNGSGNLAISSLALNGNNGSAASNYTLVGGTHSYQITPFALNVAATGVDKVYDANSAAAASLAATNAFAGDALSFNAGGASFADKNVGNGKTVSVTGIAVTGNDALNYTWNTTATTTASITPRAVTVSNTSSNKMYDGTATASTLLSQVGVLAGDVVGLASQGSTFSDANAASGKTVTTTGILLTGTDAGNYTFNTTATTTANITPYVLNLQGTRVYDGTRVVDAGVFGGSVAGLGGDVLGLAGSLLVGDKNVGTQKAATDISGISLVGQGSALSSNYTLAGGTHWATITPKTITGTITADSRVYDSTTSALTHGQLTGVVAGDDLGYVSTTGTFDTKNAGIGKTVNVAGVVDGADKANYIVNGNSTTLADITPKAITGTITADDRVYDRTINATTHGSLTGVIGGDDLSYTSTTGQFGDKNVGSGKAVTVSGIVGGADAGNYTVTSNATTTAAITKKAVTVTNVSSDKVYDGTDAASTQLAQTGVIAGDDVALGSAGSTFTDANAATGKTVTTTGIVLTGTDALNYDVNTTTTTLADITPYVLSLQGVRVYDGTNVVTAGVLGNSIAGIHGEVLGLGGSMQVADKNVGTQKAATDISGMTLLSQGGALASNYTFVGGTHWATITPKAVVVDATGSNKVYDGNNLAQATVGSGGIIGGDQVTFTGSQAHYSDRNAGTGKTITVQDITASGGDAGNYTYNTVAQTVGDITPKAVTGSIVADSKTYDGTTGAVTHGVLTGVIAGDQVAMGTQGVFADKNAGTGKTVAVGGALGGADAGNYTLSTNASTTADIRQVVINLDGTRVYDGTALASAGMFGNEGVVAGIAGESLLLSGTGALPSKNVATRETVAGLGTLSLNDHDGALAGNYTLVGGSHTATVTPLVVRAGITADDKVYDGNTSATTHGALTGVLGGDDVRLSTAGRFGDKNAAQGKTVTVDGRISGADAGNYVLDVNPTTLASITRRQVTVSATGTSKFFDGNANDVAPLSVSGVLSGDVVSFAAESTLFSDSAIGLGKTVTASGITASGADAQNYAFNTTAVTSADIMQNPSQGASSVAVAQMDAVLAPESIATPYGVAQNLSVGQYSGNHKKTRKAIEKNVARGDFTSGLSLQVVDGGVCAPADAMH